MQHEVRFDPLPGQAEFLRATEPEVLYSGSLGAGKTKVGLWKVLLMAQEFPGNELLLVRKVMADLHMTTLKDWLENVLPRRLIIQHHQSKHFTTLRTPDPARPSRVWWTGMDRILRLGGTEFGGIFYDECVEAEIDDWVMLQARLRHPKVPFHQLMGATNPGPPAHFLHDRFVRHGQETDPETGERLRRIIHANSLDNPHLPDSYRRLLSRFTGLHYERFVLGKWVGYEGLVYDTFDPSIHVVAGFPIPKEWRRGVSIDFGWGVPTSISWRAQEPSTGTWFQYRQIYEVGRTAAAFAEEFKRLSKGESIEFILSDHDLGARLEFEAQGITTIAAEKDVDQGIQKVREALRPRDGSRKVRLEDGSEKQETPVFVVPTPSGPLKFPKGAPSILFMEDALVRQDPSLLASEEKKPLQTTEEFGAYQWAKGAHGVTRDVPRKKDDHGLDELRYFFMHVDRLSTLSWGAVTTVGLEADEIEEARAAMREKGRLSTKAERVAARRARRQKT